MHLAQGAAHHGRVLRGHKDVASIDQAEAGDDAIAVARSLAAHIAFVARDDERIGLREGVGVEEQVDALPRGQSPFLMLGVGVAGGAMGRRPPRT